MLPAATTETAFSERLKDLRPVALSATGSSSASGKMQRHPAIEWLARTGYAARGAVFLILGYFTALAATGARRPLDTKDALRTLLTQPLGEFLLCLVAATSTDTRVASRGSRRRMLVFEISKVSHDFRQAGCWIPKRRLWVPRDNVTRANVEMRTGASRGPPNYLDEYVVSRGPNHIRIIARAGQKNGNS